MNDYLFELITNEGQFDMTVKANGYAMAEIKLRLYCKKHDIEVKQAYYLPKEGR